MAQLNIYLEAQSPILLGSGLAVGNVQTSRRYVPGSVWRGSLAGAILESNQSKGAEFEQIFLGTDAARFGFLYPVRQTTDEIDKIDKTTSTFMAPLTARTCKLESGFLSEGKDGVYDGVMNRLREAAKRLEPYSHHSVLEECPHCDKRLKRMRGVVVRHESNNKSEYKTASVRPRSFVRVGLNRYTETAQEGVLYVLDALVPGPGGEQTDTEKPLTFVGTWYGDEQQLVTLKDLLERSLLPDPQKKHILRIGTARARGMGKVKLKFGSWNEVTGQKEELAERLERLQPRENGQLLDGQCLYATLTLRSPLQLLDKYGLPSTQISRETLRAYHDNVPKGLEVLPKYSIVEQESWTGWSSAWKLPKPITPALAAGGVLIVRAPKDEREQLLAWLSTIEREGLGERRAEGWGEILVCDSFHVDYAEEDRARIIRKLRSDNG